MKLVFCDEDNGYRLGGKDNGLIPVVGARVIFADDDGIKQHGIVVRIGFNYTTEYDGVPEDSVFVRLTNVQRYDEYVEEKRRAFRASV